MTDQAKLKRIEDYNLITMLKYLMAWVSDAPSNVVILDILIGFDTDYQVWAATIYYSGETNE